MTGVQTCALPIEGLKSAVSEAFNATTCGLVAGIISALTNRNAFSKVLKSVSHVFLAICAAVGVGGGVTGVGVRSMSMPTGKSTTIISCSSKRPTSRITNCLIASFVVRSKE